MNTRDLPDYNTTLFPAVPSQEMALSNVTMLVFPLKASMAALSRFCDDFINFKGDKEPPPIYLKPAMPCVLLQIIDYGSLAIEWRNLGWFSQREICFSVLVEQFHKENGKYVFKDWATIAPFIYVDDASSLRNGREVFGWPKASIKLEPSQTSFRPNLANEPIRFAIKIPSTKGEGDQADDFLDVIRAPKHFQSAKDSFMDYLTTVPRLIAEAASTSTGVFMSLMDIAYSRSGDAMDPEHVRAVGSKGLDLLQSLMPGSYGGKVNKNTDLPRYLMSTINLKQFRDAAKTNIACYQAITSSCINVDRVSDMGPLYNPLAGDYSGGYRIRLYDLESQPIVRQLGLEIETSDASANIVKPVFPTWLNVDLSYSEARTICWRSGSSHWTAEEPGDHLNTVERTVFKRKITLKKATLQKRLSAALMCFFTLSETDLDDLFVAVAKVVVAKMQVLMDAHPIQRLAIQAAQDRCLDSLSNSLLNENKDVFFKLLHEWLQLPLGKQTSTSDIYKKLTEQLEQYVADAAEAFAQALKPRPKEDPAAAGGAALKSQPDYIPLGSGALAELSGSFKFDKVTVRVLPLPADAEMLTTVCNRYLNDNKERKDFEVPANDAVPPYYFEAWGSFVFGLAINFGKAQPISGGGAILPADREIALVIPVKRYRRSKQNGENKLELVDAGLAPLYVLLGSQTLVISEREVYGRPALQAEIVSPPNPWMNLESSPSAEINLLHVSTEELPALYEGHQTVKESQVVDLIANHKFSGHSRDECKNQNQFNGLAAAARKDKLNNLMKIIHAANAAPRVEGDPLRKIDAALNPFFNVGLKQVMATEDANKACYQAVVLSDWDVGNITWGNLSGQELCLAIPCQADSLAHKLGIEITDTETNATADGLIDYVNVVEPFWVQMSLERSQGRNLYSRSGTGHWTEDLQANKDSEDKKNSAIKVETLTAKENMEPLALLLRLLKK